VDTFSNIFVLALWFYLYTHVKKVSPYFSAIHEVQRRHWTKHKSTPPCWRYGPT